MRKVRQKQWKGSGEGKGKARGKGKENGMRKARETQLKESS